MTAGRRFVPLATMVMAVLVLVGLASTIATPAPVLADCGMEAPPGSVSGYRGLAFTGTVGRIERVESAGYGQVLAITYRIERMLAGPATTSLTVVEGDGGSCWYLDGRRLRVDDRVLISAAAPVDRGAGHPYLSHELVWRSTGPGTWRFAGGLYGDLVRSYPRAARAATTTREIRTLVAPADDLPETSASDATQPSPSLVPMPSLASRLTTCGGHPYPGLGVDAPVGYGSINEVQALGITLATYADEFPGSVDWPWRLAGRDETGMLFLAETDSESQYGWVYATAEPQGAGWQPGGMGDCDPRVVIAPDLGPADWWPDPDAPPPDAATTELHVLVMERDCTSGTSADGRIAEPAVDYASHAVTITIGVHSLEGDQTCQGNPATQFTVLLGEPLGDRTLLDGGHSPAIEPVPPEWLR